MDENIRPLVYGLAAAPSVVIVGLGIAAYVTGRPMSAAYWAIGATVGAAVLAAAAAGLRFVGRTRLCRVEALAHRPATSSRRV